MGALAITVLAGARIVEMADAPMVHVTRDLIAGLAVVFWAFATWLIPVLVAAGWWRHVVRKVPLRYEATLWSMIFPLGMYAVAGIYLGEADDLPVVEMVGRVELWVALAAWAVVLVAMGRHVLRTVVRGAGPPPRLAVMRLATWNVNSIRSRIDRVEAFVQRQDIDVLALQETKARDDQWPLMGLEALGYEVATLGHNQWNGVAIASRVGLADVQHGFEGMPHFGDPLAAEARAMGATCAGVRVWSLYVPNGRALGDPHLDYKLAWLDALRDAAGGLAQGRPRRAGRADRRLEHRAVRRGRLRHHPLRDEHARLAGGARGVRRRRRGGVRRPRPTAPARPRRLHLLGLLPAAVRAEPRHADRLRARARRRWPPGPRAR